MIWELDNLTNTNNLRGLSPNGKSDQSEKRFPQDKNNTAHPEKYAK